MSGLEPLRWPRLRDLSADGRGGYLLRRALRGRPAERSAAARDLAFRLARNFTSNLAIDVDGVRFHLDTEGREVSRIVFIFGLYDRPVMEAAFAALAHNGGPADFEGRLFLDMGANIGTATLTAVAHFGAGGGYAIEPDPANFRTLSVNLAANHHSDRVTAFRLALSDRAGRVEFARSELNFGDHRVRVAEGAGSDDLGESGREVIEVEGITLDELVSSGEVDLSEVGLAWIDVQGHEAHLLEGANKLLSSPVPVVVEYWPYGLRAAGSLERFQEVVAAGYESYVDLGGPKGTPRVEPRPTTDLAALAERHPVTDDHTDLLLLPG